MRKIFFLLVAISSAAIARGQTVTTTDIDFNNQGASSACNIFTKAVSGGVEELYNKIKVNTMYGAPLLKTYQLKNPNYPIDPKEYIDKKAIKLRGQYYSAKRVGDAFQIEYLFKTNCTYQVSIVASSISGDQFSEGEGYEVCIDKNREIILDPRNYCAIGEYSNSGSSCLGTSPEQVKVYNKDNFNESNYTKAYSFYGSQFKDAKYLRLSGYSPYINNNNPVKEIMIHKINIKETKYEFISSPASYSVSCNDNVVRTFTVNNPQGLGGSTVTYNWKIGAGWNYSDGTPAPSTVTTSVNSIGLKPKPNANPGDVSVDVYVNGLFWQSCSYTKTVVKPDPVISSVDGCIFINKVSTFTSSISGSSYKWSISPAGSAQIEGADNLKDVNVKLLTSSATLKLDVTNECGIVGSKTFQIIPPASPTLLGYNVVCSNSTFSLQGLPSCLTVAWSISPANIASLSINGNEATLTKITDGTVILTATIKSGSQVISTLTREVYLGTMTTAIKAYDATYDPCGSYGYFSCDEVKNAQKYIFYFDGIELSAYADSRPAIYLDTNYPEWRNSPGFHSLQVRVQNECGLSALSDAYMIEFYDCGQAYSIANNPSDQSFDILFSNASTSKTIGLQSSTTPNVVSKNNPKLYDFKLYDKQMKLVKTAKSTGENVRIITSDLPNEVYYLIITEGKNTTTKQIMVKH